MLGVQKYQTLNKHRTESYPMIVNCHQSVMQWEQGGRGTVTLARQESCRNSEYDVVGMTSWLALW